MTTRLRSVPSPLTSFLQTEAAGATVLLVATAVALAWANSPWSSVYNGLWGIELTAGGLPGDLRHWVNEGLMAVFFFVIGLEVKREVVTGRLRSLRTASLPIVAAFGGMVLPAALFAIVAGGGEVSRGWAIPMATDTAFVVGILTLLGSRVPRGLKAFVLATAVVDDIVAMLVIGVVYTGRLEPVWLVGAAACFLAVIGARALKVCLLVPYALLGIGAWVCTYQSGVHGTLAGVVLGLLIPVGLVGGRPLLEDLEGLLHPWSSFVVLPVFAIANAGIVLDASSLARAGTSRLTWAVFLGLVVGKGLGISLATWAALRLRLGRLPQGVSFGHVLGAAPLAGIGFTVSLFLTELAFDAPVLQEEARIGILLGSLASGITALLVLGWRRRPYSVLRLRDGDRADGHPAVSREEEDAGAINDELLPAPTSEGIFHHLLTPTRAPQCSSGRRPQTPCRPWPAMSSGGAMIGHADHRHRPAMAHGRDTSRSERVYWLISIVHPENRRSQRVAAKLGMRRDRQIENPVLGRLVDVWICRPADPTQESERADPDRSGGQPGP